MPKTKNEHHGYRGDISDFPTIDRALLGEQLAYEELFQKHKARIFRFFMRSTKGNIAYSEEFVQDTFVSAFSKLRTFNKNAAFCTWLCRIAVNIFLMSCRSKKHHFVPIDEICGPQIIDGKLFVEGHSKNDHFWDGNKRNGIGRLDQALENVLNQITVEKFIRDLPPGCKRILILHDLKGLEYKEVAAKLGCSLGNVKSQRHKALIKLRAAVQTTHA